MSFCKDNFSDFKFNSGSDEGTIYYRAKNVSIAILKDNSENAFALSGKAEIYVTFNSEKVITQIEAFVVSVSSEEGRLGYRLTQIGTYDNGMFDYFTVPDEQ